MAAETNQKTRAIDHTFRINASPEAVWEAITTADGLTNWFPPEARVTPGEGGEMWLSWGEGMEGSAEIKTWSPPTADGAGELVLYSGEGGYGALPTTQHWRIEGDGGETVLRLVHSGFGVGADFDGEFDSVNTGWQLELTGLKHYLEAHPGGTREIVKRIRPVNLSVNEAHERLLGRAPGIGDPLTLDLPGFGPLTGEVRVNNAPKDVGMVAPVLNNALVRVMVEACGGPQLMAWMWASCYGVDEATREKLGAAFDAYLDEKLR